MIAQKETKILNRRIIDLETDRAGLQSLLSNHTDKSSSQVQTASLDVDKLHDLIEDLKTAAQGRSSENAAQALENRVVEYGNTVKETNAKLAAREEVQRKPKKLRKKPSSTLPPHSIAIKPLPTITESPQLSPNTKAPQPPLEQQQTPSSPTSKRQSLRSFFGLKANNKSPIVASPQPQRRTPWPPGLPAATPIPPARAAYSSKGRDDTQRGGRQ